MRIGRYEVIGHLATGGMAQIYLARQTGLGSFERHVVLKTILRERATDQRFVTMFLDEAKLAATLNHQNVAQVYEVDQDDGSYFMALEYVHGENARTLLETTIRRGWTIPLELAIMIISGAAAGLHHAHERRGKNGQPLQIVHRDVSPANIMVGYDGSVKVLDFGIAKAEERITQTVGGAIKGKYGYMSPEQCKGRTIDRRSDIFALGIVLYELTTLRRAFKGKDDFETMKRIVAGDLVLPSTMVPGYPRELESIVLTALATDPAARFQTGQELIEALDAFTVRAKLTGTNTAMGRFMLQLFGTRKEPWLDPAVHSTEHTLVTPAELDDYEDENDETLVLGNRQDVQRVLSELNLPVRTPAAVPPGAAAPVGAPEPAEPPMRPSPVPELAKRPSVRRPGERPSLPFASSAPSGAPSSAALGAPVGGSLGADRMSVAAATAAQLAERSRPSHPNLAMPMVGSPPLPEGTPAMPMPPVAIVQVPLSPLAPVPPPPVAIPPATTPPMTMPASAGSFPAMPARPVGHGAPGTPAAPVVRGGPGPAVPLAPSGLPALVANDDISEVGARPLVTDPRLGWNTQIKLTAPVDGSHTRVPGEQVEFRIRSNARWLIVAVVLVLVGIAVILLLGQA